MGNSSTVLLENSQLIGTCDNFELKTTKPMAQKTNNKEYITHIYMFWSVVAWSLIYHWVDIGEQRALFQRNSCIGMDTIARLCSFNIQEKHIYQNHKEWTSYHFARTMVMFLLFKWKSSTLKKMESEQLYKDIYDAQGYP